MANVSTLGICLAEGGAMSGTLTHVAAGAIGAVAVAILSHHFSRSRTLHEQLTAKYSEFVGLVSDEIVRSRAIAASFAIGNHSDDERGDSEREYLKNLYEQGTKLLGDLERVSKQLLLLETDTPLIAQIKKLANSQPFIVPGNFHRGNFNERFTKFEQDINDYSKLLDSLHDGVTRRQRSLWSKLTSACNAAIKKPLSWWSKLNSRFSSSANPSGSKPAKTAMPSGNALDEPIAEKVG